MSWNKNSAKVIGITAAAAMALSLAPATAFTAYAAPRNGSSVSEQAVSSKYDFEHGFVSKALVDGIEQTVKKGDPFVVVYNGNVHHYIPTEVTTQSGQKIQLMPGSSSTDLIDGDGVHYTINPDVPADVANVERGITRSDGAVISPKAVVRVIPASLENAKAYRIVSDPNDLSNTTFTFNGQPQRIGFSLNGKMLRPGTDYTVRYVVKGQAESTATTTAPTNAGDYVALLLGRGEYSQDVERKVQFTINKLDLSKATVTLPDQEFEPGSGDLANVNQHPAPLPGDISVNGVNLGSALGAGINGEIDPASFKLVSGPNADLTFGPKGHYTYSIAAKSNAKDVTGSANVSFNVVGQLLNASNVKYNGVAWASAPAIHTDLDATNPSKFDASKVSVTSGSVTLNSNQYKISVEKQQADGSWAAVSGTDISTPGTYRVSVAVNAEAPDYNYGGGTGDIYLRVKVDHSVPASVFVYLDGRNIGNDTSSVTLNNGHYYTGKAHQLTVRVVSGANSSAKGADLKEGTDYTVALTKDGKSVNSILDHGTYQVVVNPLNGWRFVNGEPDVSNITILPMQVKPEFNPDQELKWITAHAAFAWNNDHDVKPGLIFRDQHQTDNNGNQLEVSVPDSAYAVRYVYNGVNGRDADQNVNAPTKKGFYKAIITDIAADDNYAVMYEPLQFEVTSARYFEDIPNNSYYTNHVYNIGINGIMHGYNGTHDFGPFNNLQRYQAAVVIFNIARYNANASRHDETNVLQYDRNHVTKTPFKDVRLNKGDATAVAWAAANHIVTGYGNPDHASNNLFRPYQNVSRQEFAVMLQRYASKLDGYTAGKVSDLDSYTDRSDVASWAENGVAWAVSNKLMGQKTNNKLNATSPIFRADTAVMIDRSNLVK